MKKLEVVLELGSVNQAEYKKLRELTGTRAYTEAEYDALSDEEKKRIYDKLGAIYTDTELEYDGENCTVRENGIEKKIKLPIESGEWYKIGEFGLPLGAKSNAADKDARRLWRADKNKGFVVRGCYRFVGGGRRDVDCDYDSTDRYGVVLVKEAK
jgi:hypothetical protein